jgi:hypothetical protein
MSEFYQIACLVPSGRSAEKTVRECHEFLRLNRIEMAEDSLLLLHEFGQDEPDPEPISDDEAALKKLLSWPTFGTIDYAAPEGIITVSYFGSTDAGGITCVMISIPDGIFERSNARPRYTDIARKLHRKLEAKRTIMDWALQAHGFSYDAELTRLKSGQFSDSYAMLDLRAE